MCPRGDAHLQTEGPWPPTLTALSLPTSGPTAFTSALLVQPDTEHKPGSGRRLPRPGPRPAVPHLSPDRVSLAHFSHPASASSCRSSPNATPHHRLQPREPLQSLPPQALLPGLRPAAASPARGGGPICSWGSSSPDRAVPTAGLRPGRRLCPRLAATPAWTGTEARRVCACGVCTRGAMHTAVWRDLVKGVGWGHGLKWVGPDSTPGSSQLSPPWA